MTEQEKRKLNEKLAKWANLEDALGLDRVPRFTDSFDACSELLVPKLYPYPQNKFDIHFKRNTSYPEHINEVNCWFYLDKMYEGWSLNSLPLAFCLAVEQFIDKKIAQQGKE